MIYHELLEKLKSYSFMALAILLILVGAYRAGSNAARKAYKLERDADALKASRRYRNVELETYSMSDYEIYNDLANEWVRNKSDE